jgi:hypothetical protein
MLQLFATHKEARLGSVAEFPWTGAWETMRRALGLQPQPRERWSVGRSVELVGDEVLIYDLGGRQHRFPKVGIHDMAFVGRKRGWTADLWIWYSPRDGRSTYEMVYAGTFGVRSDARRRTERRLMRLGLMMDRF